MEIVRELRKQGMIQGKDFDFAYNRVYDDGIIDYKIAKSHVKFTFYKEKYATFFILKWS